MPKTLSELTVDELRDLIREVVSQTIEELFIDPDVGLQLHEAMREALQKSIREVHAGAETLPAEAVARQLGLEW